MKRYISREDNKYYTYMLDILNAIGGRNLKYNWLITDIEAYPLEQSIVDKISNEYVLISTDDLLDLLEQEDFQWIWGVFSAISPIHSQQEILKYELPIYSQEDWKNDMPYSDSSIDSITIQHPLAEIEIVAFDSTYVQITCKDEKIADMFLDKYRLSKQQ